MRLAAAAAKGHPILKKLGIGLSGLSRCRLVDRETLDANTASLTLLVEGDPHRVVSRTVLDGSQDAGHVLSVATADDVVTFLPACAEATA